MYLSFFKVLLRDYAAIPELDKYDDEDLASDNGDYAALDYQTRRQIDETLDRRDREERRTRREDMVDDLVGIANQPQARVETFRRYGSAALERGSEEEDDITATNLDSDVNLEAFEVPLREWIAQERTRNEIKKKFKHFLNSYKSTRDTPLVHDAKIK
jgi:DNA replication licensing factor MCM2